jgi:hypothetical protein
MSTYATRLIPACKALAAELTAAGVPATLSRETLRVPGAWVRPDTINAYTLQGDEGPARARISVILVAPAANDAEALGDLVGLLDKTLGVIDPDDDVDTSVLLPLRGNNLPAFRVVTDLEV